MIGARQLAEQTPAQRERVVDFLRALAITAVVVGHWLVSVVEYDSDGELTGRSALPELPWAYPLTWLVQVLPLFFLVGGYANAASLAGRWARGGDTVGWLVERGRRLVRPTTALLVVLAAGAGIARLGGAPPEMVRTAVWSASIPLWFLAVYLVVVLVAPVTYRLHRRFGWAVPAVAVGLVAVGDLARFGYAPQVLGWANTLIGWLAIHQVGYAWRDGRLPRRRAVAVGLFIGGLGAAVLATTVGPYPVSMVDVPGERVHNMSPPTLALLALAAAQIGLVLLVHQPLDRWLRRSRRAWQAVVATNAVIMTVFLWHVTAAVIVAGVLGLLGWLPTPPVGSAAWFAWRIPWLLLVSVALVGLVAVFGRVEQRGRQRPHWPRSLPQRWTTSMTRGLPRVALTVAGFALAVVGLVGDTSAGQEAPEPLGMPAFALTAYLLGAALLAVLHAGDGGQRVA
jgi:peptidoglycan/LPS O-acetylase OafA/YrhL